MFKIWRTPQRIEIIQESIQNLSTQTNKIVQDCKDYSATVVNKLEEKIIINAKDMCHNCNNITGVLRLFRQDVIIPNRPNYIRWTNTDYGHEIYRCKNCETLHVKIARPKDDYEFITYDNFTKDSL